MTAQHLIENPLVIRPHVVLLGAGASRAAFPSGDASGQRIPVMDDLVDIIELRPLLERAGLNMDRENNFEVTYSQLFSNAEKRHIVREIELRIDEFFSGLRLPDRTTIYDRLLISLRSTDAVFTFNWDPFLFDAYERNLGVVPLPAIYFLHGNVRIGACRAHHRSGPRHGQCPECGEHFAEVPLLYPIGQKNYSENAYIRRSWECARTLFRDAFTLTIFGYGAPDSDADAISLLRAAWFARSGRTFEHVEIIDNAPAMQLCQRWSPFAPTSHYHISAAFEQCRIARWPRRSCESLLYPMAQGLPCEDFPLPSTDSIAVLQASGAKIARHEQCPRDVV